LELYHHHFEVAPRKGLADFDVNQWQLKLNRSFLDDSWHTIGDDFFGLILVHFAVSLIIKVFVIMINQWKSLWTLHDFSSMWEVFFHYVQYFNM
jgi:hypothetical protein